MAKALITKALKALNENRYYTAMLRFTFHPSYSRFCWVGLYQK